MEAEERYETLVKSLERLRRERDEFQNKIEIAPTLEKREELHEIVVKKDEIIARMERNRRQIMAELVSRKVMWNFIQRRSCKYSLLCIVHVLSVEFWLSGRFARLQPRDTKCPRPLCRILVTFEKDGGGLARLLREDRVQDQAVQKVLPDPVGHSPNRRAEGGVEQERRQDGGVLQHHG